MLPHHIDYIESLGYEATTAVMIPDTLLFTNEDNSRMIAVKGGFIEFHRKITDKSNISSILDSALISSMYLDDNPDDLQLIAALFALGVTNVFRFKQDWNQASEIIKEFERTKDALSSIAATMKANRLVSKNNVVAIDDRQFEQELGMSVVVLAEQFENSKHVTQAN